jgi:hypothetical protein
LDGRSRKHRSLLPPFALLKFFHQFQGNPERKAIRQADADFDLKAMQKLVKAEALPDRKEAFAVPELEFHGLAAAN